MQRISSETLPTGRLNRNPRTTCVHYTDWLLPVHAGESQSKRTYTEIKDKKVCEYAQRKQLFYNYKIFVEHLYSNCLSLNLQLVQIFE